MSRAPQKRRPGQQQQTINNEDPVRVTKTSGKTVLGVVESKHRLHGHCSVCVSTASGELVTARDRVEPVSGVDAKQARQEAERGDND